MKIDGFELKKFINEPNRKLNEACKIGDLEKVRKLLNHDDPYQRADIEGSAFYHACKNFHREIIAYLLSSPELAKHVIINDKEKPDNKNSFTVLCNARPEMVQEFIYELPLHVVQDMQQFIINEFTVNKEILITTLKKRAAKDFSNELDNELPKHNNKSRTPKI